MNIICFDTEWRYNHHRKKEQFNLKCEHGLEVIKAYHDDFDFIYEKFLTRADLLHYMEQFNGNRMKSRYQVIYISCHGEESSICFEGERKKEQKSISLDELVYLYKGFFEDRFVHFSSCSTMKDIDAAKRFKRKAHAKCVSGYQTDVDAMDSLILDMAYFNALQEYKSIGTLKRSNSLFQQHYASLIDYLQFVIV